MRSRDSILEFVGNMQGIFQNVLLAFLGIIGVTGIQMYPTVELFAFGLGRDR